MDDPKAVILDISSDEEPAFGGGGGGDEFKSISDLFGEDDDKADDDDDDWNNDSGESDDVVVVGEVFVNRRQRTIKSSNSVSKRGGDDEDCVVLDADPDKPVAIENGKEEDDDDSDDLVVISEKGEVACRDFPHPRHLCAKFPFDSTPHEKHCDQCHCYVCDSLAPCVHWMTGIDHCHATDKDEFWKAQRKISMRSDKAPPVVPAATDSALPMRPPLLNQPSPLSSNLVLQNQVLRHPTIRPCSVPTSNVMPHITRQGRAQHPGYVVPRSKFEPNLLPQHLHSGSNHVRDRRHYNGNLGPQFSSPRMNFKRTQPVGVALPTDRSGYKSSNHNYGFSRNPPSTARWQGSCGGLMPVSDAYQDSYMPNVGQVANSMSSQTELATQPIVGNAFANYMPLHPQMPSQQNVSCGYANYVPPLPQMSSQQHVSSGYADYVPQTLSQQQVAAVFANSVASQPSVSSQQHLSGHFGNPLPSQAQVASQPFVGGSFENPLSAQPQVSSVSQQNGEYSEPSQPQASWQLDPGNAFQFPVPSQSVTPSLPNTESTLENPPSPHQLQIYSQPTLTPNNSQTSLQQGNQTLDASGSNSAVSDFSWLTYTSPSSQQLPVDNSQVESAEPTHNSSVSKELCSQFPGSPDFGPSDLQYDNWFFEHESFSEALEVSATPGLNVSSPEPASVDGGLFFNL